MPNTLRGWEKTTEVEWGEKRSRPLTDHGFSCGVRKVFLGGGEGALVDDFSVMSGLSVKKTSCCQLSLKKNKGREKRE